MLPTHTDYDAPTLTLNPGDVNIEVALVIAGRVTPASFVRILTDIACAVRLNSTSFDSIVVPVGAVGLVIPADAGMAISKLFFTHTAGCGGGSPSVTILAT